MKSRIVLIIFVLSFLLVSVITDTLLVSPSDGIHLTERKPEFRFIGSVVLVVDNDRNFESPIIETEASHIYKPLSSLPIGTYYWKVIKGNVESEVRQFTIDSVVATKIDDNKLINDGNVRVGVSQGITGAVVGTLDPGEFLELEKQGVYTSRQDE